MAVTARYEKKEDKTTPVGSIQSSDSIDEDTKDKGTVQLKREVGLVKGVALIVGSMIGAGIFISPKGVLLGANSVGMSLVVWLVCAVISLLAAMCYAELGAVIPRAGSTYQYVLHTYGDLAGFMVAWSMVVVLKPAGLALTAITLGTYISDYITPGDCAPPTEAVKLFAILAVMIVAFINCASVRLTSSLVVVFTTGKVIALAVIIVAGLVKLFQGQTQYLDPKVSFVGSTTHILGYGTALYHGFWAYSGWEILNNLPEELKNPTRNIPLAIFISLPTVTVIYLLTNIAYFTTLSPNELLASSAVAMTFANRTLGPMSWLIPLGVCISTFGSLLGYTLSSTRVTYAAAREGHMVKVMSMVSVKLLTPFPAVLLQGTTGIVLILIGNFNSILVFTGFVSWMFYGLAFISVLVLRRKFPDQVRPFKSPSPKGRTLKEFSNVATVDAETTLFGRLFHSPTTLLKKKWPANWVLVRQVNFLIPIFAGLVSVFMILAPLISSPTLEYLYALVMLALGLVVYIVFVQGKRQLPFMGHMTLFLQKLFLISPSRNLVK